MAYESQARDLAVRVTTLTKNLLDSVEEIKQEIAYNNSQQVITSENNSGPLFNGVTGEEILSIFNSISELDEFLSQGQHYKILNKVR